MIYEACNTYSLILMCPDKVALKMCILGAFSSLGCCEWQLYEAPLLDEYRQDDLPTVKRKETEKS